MNITRGDTKNIKFKVQNANKKDSFWQPADGDKVYFTCKKDENTVDVIFQKVYPESMNYDEESKYFSFKIESKDTKSIAYGRYLYDIEIKTKGDENKTSDVKTVTLGELNVTKEITFGKNEV